MPQEQFGDAALTFPERGQQRLALVLRGVQKQARAIVRLHPVHQPASLTLLHPGEQTQLIDRIQQPERLARAARRQGTEHAQAVRSRHRSESFGDLVGAGGAKLGA